MGKISVPSPIRTTHSAPQALVWGTGSPRCHCHLEPASSQPWDGDKARTAPPALPLHGAAPGPAGQDPGSPAQPSIRSSISAAAQHRNSQGSADTAGTCQGSPHTPRGHVGKAINWNVNRSAGKNCLLTTREGCSATVLYHKSHLYDLPSVSQITHVQSPMSAFKSEHGIFSQK